MKKILSLTVILNILLTGMYTVFEPQIIKADQGPGAGPYQDQITVTLTVGPEISITAPADVNMSPDISGITGGSSYGTSTWTVITNNTTGFNMTLKASSSPAMAGNTQGDNFANYTPSGTTTPEFTWALGSNDDAEFGYTVEPATAADTALAFRDTGTICGAGSNQASYACWQAATTTAYTIINRTTATGIGGEAEAVGFRAQAGSNAFKLQDTYTATTTVTVTMNP